MTPHEQHAVNKAARMMREWRKKYVGRDTNGTLRALTGRNEGRNARMAGPDEPIVELRKRGLIDSRRETALTAMAFDLSRRDG